MPLRKNMPQQRSVLTRSMSHNWSLRTSQECDTWFKRVEDDRRIEKRPGVSECKVAFRKGRLAPARLESMKNLFDKLDMDDKRCETECDYCKSANRFFCDDREAQECDGVCTCMKYESGPIVRLLPRRTLSRIASCDENICPHIVQEEEFTNWRGPFPCRLVNPSTGLEWEPKPSGKIRVVLSPRRGLHYWVLAGSMNGKVVHIFGYQHAGVWRYATAKFGRRGGRIEFQQHNKHPSELEIDTNAPITDPRAFYIGGTASSRQNFVLSPASNDGLNVFFVRKWRLLQFTDADSQADYWKFED